MRRAAVAKFRLWREDPRHSSLHFKRLKGSGNNWSLRVTADYRAVGRRTGDHIEWFWIGSHGEYDELMKRL
ncbi:MAG: hypothetical protein IH855_06660 [Bacteroidetes bacterium]|nr:hypothetical protein [Bacteroidota bacterium]